jgi:hypothetical protein
MNVKYYLDDLQDFSDKQILQILKYFKAKSVDPITDRLEAILLSYDNDLLEEVDVKYVESDRFGELFLSSDEQLRKLAEELGYIGNYNHIDMIKFIIDNDIKIVDSIPSVIKDKIEVYQMNKDLYVCGVGTFKIKDDLKSMNGRWDAKNKCWILPLVVKPNLMELVGTKVPNKQAVNRINKDIPMVNQIPTKIEHNLQLYQINNDILICGKKTYDLKEDLKSIGSTFNGKYKCWSIPHDQIDYIVDLIEENKEKEILEKERIQAQKTLTRLENLEKKRLIEKENLIVQKRLDKEEKELPFIRHIDRLSKDESNQLTNKIYKMMEELDAKELKEIWKDKIIHTDYKISEDEAKFRRKHDRGSYKYVTYIGDYRPSDYVLILYANDWYPLVAGQPGYSVKRVDYKIYEIYAWSTD